MKKILELTSISAGYHDSLVLKDASLTVFERDFLGVIGPNGGGKTTLLKVILGLIAPFSGSVSFHDRSLQGRRKAIGYLPQFRIIDREFPITVRDVVSSGLMNGKGLLGKLTADDRDRCEALMDRFGISHLRERPIGALSGGQTQRVFLCRALVSSPKLLILDEPDTFIDSGFSQDLNEILAELNREMAIILVSHDIGTLIAAVKNVACVNHSLHYHSSEEFSKELMDSHNCPVHIVGHGEIPHTILKKHGQFK